ncbi:hypothetical protein [Petrachloros mirabilis]
MMQSIVGVVCGLTLVAGMGACDRAKISEKDVRPSPDEGKRVEQTVKSDVKPTCIISWDPSEDARISEYRVTVWKAVAGKASDKAVYKVKPPATQVSCKQVGVAVSGEWQASVQACLKDGICSDSSKPIFFKVVDE